MTKSFDIEVFVRFAETDAAGHINNTSYFLYFEEARTKFFYEIGIGKTNKNPLMINFILASTKCDYISQAFGGKILKVSTIVTDIGTKSFTVHHEITNSKEEVVARATATLVCFNYAEQKTEPIPDSIRNKLEEVFSGVSK
ncbi:MULTISPECIES: acyl-CoA thioesterase [Oceanobacillus]|uniref:Thioesterase n=1 Tax=Oceanobacillus indicireducens TaxID=1004261 RepID=A0A917XUC6_9BACI|nr:MULTISPECIES: thioesterase family protein [Oceanobacillus]MCF3942960.1 acyl-CoA thioesterase [Oceanobacillus alkalisoli]MCG5102299.1 acyl-CoA thioesterase [Oceanobacillus alkalisoli]GGN52293.1 thioesterase [Oceanobacillus indicireducens]